MFNFQSSAIDSISELNGDQVQITFVGGREYTYRAADPSTFVADLNQVIAKQESVGGFVNRAIRSEQLLSV